MVLYHERGQAPGHPGGLLSCLGWNLLLTAASSCLSEPRLGQAGKQRQRPGGRTPSLERQHHQHALACERRRRGWVWMSTSSSDSVESQSRFPDVLWTQPNKRKETGTREPRQPAATTSWKHFSRLTSEVSDLRRRAAWPTLFGCL